MTVAAGRSVASSGMGEAMAGGGEYDRHSEAQARDALSQSELVTEAAEAISDRSSLSSVVIADYGCAQGRASNPLIRSAIDRVRRAHPDVPIMVVHNDLITNDWAGLFARLGGDGSYLRAAGGPITPLASATSFYEPVVPRHSVDLGLSFAALQWLSQPGPQGTPGALFFDQLPDDARGSMARLAEADWTRFLSLRADELAPGGRMVLDMMGRHDDGPATGHDLWRIASEAGEAMASDGALDRARLDDYVVPLYERTLGEVRRPCEADLSDRLELESLAIADSTHPVIERFADDGDRDALAAAMTGFFRAFSEPSLRAALALDDAGLDDFYGRVKGLIRDQAESFSFEVHPITAVIARPD